MSKSHMRVTALSALLAAIVVPSAARAGAVTYFPVQAVPGEWIASGHVDAARISPDGTEYIGCQTIAGTTPQVSCWAQDSSGDYVSCTSTSANYVALAEAINDASYIQFAADPNGTCKFLEVDTTSLELNVFVPVVGDAGAD